MKALLLDRHFLPRVVVYAVLAGVFTLLAVGIPTVLIPNHLFSRAVPTRPVDYVIYGITVALAAVLGAAYALPAACPLRTNRLTAGGFLSFLAVGCPVCNKVVVLLIGATGALTYFQPIQPLLGVAGIVLLASGLVLRLRDVRATLAPAAAAEPAPAD
ncbi:MAG TPA: hypothetical protein VFN57_18200 [Thermomicrobiaceae bacterium]|nr:hypothetical protein [Thermomicrobiaceae bacterium]